MKKKNKKNKGESIYILISHYSESSDYQIIASTCDLMVFKNALQDYELEYNEEEFNRAEYEDFGFIDDMRYVAYKFKKEIPQNRKLYMLFGNGYSRFSWEGEVIGLYTTKKELKDAIIKYARLDSYFDTKKEINEELKSLDHDGFYVDPDSNCFDFAVLSFPKPNVEYSEDGKILLKAVNIKGDFKVPNSVIEIADNAFENNKALKKVELSKGLRTIGNYAFSGCDSLKEVVIPSDSNLWCIGEGAFADCKKLKSIELPDTTESIYPLVFGGCQNLQEVRLTNTLEHIPEHAFYGCKKLKSIVIPPAVTEIAECAFSECESLTSLTIPDSVKIIGFAAFAGCKKLTTLTLPKSIDTIDGDAFLDCPNLKKVFCKRLGPWGIDDEAFDNYYTGKCVLYIPKGAMEEYQSNPIYLRFHKVVEQEDL